METFTLASLIGLGLYINSNNENEIENEIDDKKIKNKSRK